MKRTMILAALMGNLILGSCQQKQTEEKPQVMSENVLARNITECDIQLGNLTFTHALNGADTCIAVKEQDKLEFSCTEKRDIFCDPNGKRLFQIPFRKTEKTLSFTADNDAGSGILLYELIRKTN